jgi:uncharacterized protein
MLSFDSNLLFYAYNSSSPWHGEAASFLSALQERQDVVISELVLVELYTLLRNPVVVERPLTPEEAVGVIEQYRRHPHWRLQGFPEDSPRLHRSLWKAARKPHFARRRVYDARLALTLLQQGVREFATANTDDFADFGFERVFNPLVKA